jgi:hypothetical protein
MKAFVLVAEKGRGKSTEAFRIVDSFTKKDLYVWDKQGQYKKYKNNKIKGLPSIEQFLQIVANVKDAVIVFEESTIFFGNKSRSEIVVDLLISNYHTKNVIIFIFHSLRSVPVEIMDFVDFIRLYHTNDRATLINNKFKDDPQLLEIFNSVNEKTFNTDKNRDTGEFLDAGRGVEYSREFYHHSEIYSR